MEVNVDGTVTFKDSYIVEFLLKHASNKILLNASVGVLKSFFRSSEEFMDNYSINDNMTNHINALESSYKSYVNMVDHRLDEVNQNISCISESITDKISAQVTKILLVTEDMVSRTIKQLDVSTISNTLNESIQLWLRDTLIDNNSMIVSELEDNIKNYMNTNLITPLIDHQTKVIENVNRIPSQVVNDIDTSNTGIMLDHIGKRWEIDVSTIRSNIMSIDDGIVDLIQKWANMKELDTLQQKHIIDTIQNVPMITKGVMNDIIRNLEQQSYDVNTTLNNAQQQLLNISAGVSGIQTNLSTKIATIERKIQTTQIKGIIGENGLFDKLAERLKDRDGYSVEKVSGYARSCDIVINRTSYPTIRIECKAVGKDTGEKVHRIDVEKFKRDLLSVNNHGIFVSLHSAIVGIGAVEIQQLSNGKFAIYLSNNNYDINIIEDMLHVLYKLDRVLNSDVEDDTILLSTETMMHIKRYITDFNGKISTLKAQMKESINVLNSIQLSALETTILGMPLAEKEAKEKLSEMDMTCKWCNKTFRSKQGFIGHGQKCKKLQKNNEKNMELEQS